MAASRPDPAPARRVVAVGDVHGACDELVRHLKATGLVDGSLRWVGGRTHLVQTGDVLDRGPAPLAALDLLMRLAVEAAEAGGRVYALLGNHELMAVESGLGDPLSRTCWLSPANGGAATFAEWRRRSLERGDRDRPGQVFFSLFAPTGRYGRWFRQSPAVLKLGSTLFCHAGLDDPRGATPGWAEAVLWTALDARDFTHPWLCGAGPLWTRQLRPDGVIAVLELLGCRRMVVGHTPQPSVRAFLGGRLVNIDAGMWCGGPGGALVIEGDRVEVVSPDGSSRPLPAPRH
ncbi:MAG: metallophosphoesterase [Acetobacteraceae bacterium]|nr:metallophosphoesterase [Acetobacteraceae bacterium]